MCGKLENRETVERTSIGQSQRRTDSQRRGPERCNSREKTCNVVDIDNDKLPNFIVIDPPESSWCSSTDIRTSQKEKAPAPENIICIDDDDDDDESGDCGSHRNGFEDGRNRGHCFTTSNKFHPAADQSHKSQPASSMPNKSGHLNYREKKSSSELSGFQNSCSCSRKVSSHNQYGFGQSTLSENDDSDCDIVEDYLGSIRQQWEKASLRKKRFKNVSIGQSGSQDEVSGSKFNSQNNVDMKKTAEAPIPSTATNQNHENINFSSSASHGKSAVSGPSDKSSEENLTAVFQENIQQEMLCKTHLWDPHIVNDMASESMSNTQAKIKLNHPTLVTNSNGHPDAQNCIIANREKLKETDAYKSAEEEEWACRQRELRIQAEEVQRLRKRKKADALRLLEMERRQKQRVEEIREAQKKDMEMLNLKEQFHVGLRREISNLEANCSDMASLLRGLGISVAGGVSPSSSEVRTAYKQALLRFHPDRASRGDIHQQIEAEEKFKLISRAKERFYGLMW